MLKRLLIWLLGLVLLLSLAGPVKAADKVMVEFFHSSACSHCIKEKAFLKELDKEYRGMKVESYEISQPYSQRLWQEAGERLGVEVGSVPFTVIGDKHWTGFNEETIGKEIEAAVLEALGELEEESASEAGRLKLPFVGKVDPKTLSLPILTFLVALLDGFNPCAMWTLLFLISLLLGMKDRKRMWLLGLTFIVTSGLIYFLVLAAWLNVFLLVGLVKWVRLAIGIFALGAGGWALRDWWKNRDGGCEVVGEEKRDRVFGRLKKVVKKQELLWAMLGIVVLAVVVNMVEFVCSAGLPAVYTQVLAMNNLPAVKYYLYLVFYILIFMLDDMVVFGIAMVTLKAVGIESKYARWSRLIGGLVMLGIGLAMLFKPEWLSFS